MPDVWCFDREKGEFDSFYVDMDGQMPLVERMSLTPGDLLYPGEDRTFWTERGALLHLDRLAGRFPGGFTVDGGFHGCGGAGAWALAGRAGLCFDVGRTLPARDRAALTRAALEGGLFSGVLPPFLAGRSLRIALRLDLPYLRAGEAGVCALALQDALARAGCYGGPLTGRLDGETMCALGSFRGARALEQTAGVDGRCWRALLSLTNSC